MEIIQPIENFKVTLFDLNLEPDQMKKFFVFASEILGYELESIDDKCYKFQLAEKPKDKKYFPSEKISLLNYAKSMPSTFKVCFDDNAPILDFNFFGNKGLFGKSKLNAKIQNFLNNLYEAKKDFEQQILAGISELPSVEELELHHKYQPIVTIVLPVLFLIYYLAVAFLAKSNIFDLSVDALKNFGGSFSTLNLNGQWWRLLTNIFLHGDLNHLVSNIAALISIGTLLEPRIGSVRFLLAFLATGIIGSAFSTMNNHFVVSVGASGAIMGLYAIFFVLLAFKKVRIRRNAFLDIAVLVVFTLGSGIFDSGIDNSAHFAGFFSGVLFGALFIYDFKGKQVQHKPATIFLPIIFALLVSTFILGSTPDYYKLWLRTAAKSDSLASQGQTFYELLLEKPNASNSELLAAIENDISKRKEALDLFRQSDRFKLSKFQQDFANYMKEYLSAWLESYYILRAIYSDDTTSYADPLDTLVKAYFKLTSIIKRDSIYNIPDVWIPHNIIFNVRYQKFQENEQQALAFYRLLENKSSSEQLINALEEGNKIWNSCKSLFDGFDTLNIAPENKRKVQLLRQYCSLRMDSYNALLDYYRNNNQNALSLYNDLTTKISSIALDIANADGH